MSCAVVVRGDWFRMTCPRWQALYYYFSTWKKDGTWESVHDQLHGDLRESVGRKRNPSAGIIDSQSVKTTEKGAARLRRGQERSNGRKRHILVDTLGLLIAVVVHPADIQDRDARQIGVGNARGQLEEKSA